MYTMLKYKVYTKSKVRSTNYISTKHCSKMKQSPVYHKSLPSFQRNICRTCLRKIKPPDVIDIFSDDPFYKGQSFRQVFQEITATLIDAQELLPLNICPRCARRLKQAVAYKRSVEQADTVLRRNIRMAEITYAMKKSDSINSALDNLCSKLTEIENEYEDDQQNVVAKETPVTAPTKSKGRDVVKYRTCQANIADFMAGKTSAIKTKKRIKITNKTLNIDKNQVVNGSQLNESNINEPFIKERSTDKNVTKSDATITNDKECVSNLSDKKNILNTTQVVKPHLQLQSKTANVDLPKNHASTNDLDVLKDIVNDVELGDSIILIEDTANSTKNVTKDNSMVKKIIDKVSLQSEVIVINDNSNDQTEKENSTPPAAENISRKSIVCNSDKEQHNLNKTNGLKQKMSYAQVEDDKPIECTKCNKKFTNLNILERHMLYHSLDIEPNEDPKAKQNKPPQYSSTPLMDAYRMKKAQNRFFQPSIKKIIFPNDYPMDSLPVASDMEKGEVASIPSQEKQGSSTDSTGIANTSNNLLYSRLTEKKSDLNSTYLRTVPMESSQKTEYLIVPASTVIPNRCCKYCSKGIARGEMGNHLYEAHPEQLKEERRKRRQRRLQLHQCPICKKGNTSKALLLSHIRAQHELKFKCRHCNKGFIRKEPLLKHLTTVHGEKETALCYICGKLVSSTSIKAHMMSHSAVKSYKCTYKDCNTILKYKKSLELHIRRLHGTEKPFICERCGKMYTDREGLRQHMRSHWDVLPYYCDVCERGFALRHKFKKHFITHHQRLKQFTCPMCPQVFTYKASIKKHCTRYHPEYPLPEKKPLSINTKYKSNGIPLVKGFECTLCPRRLASEYNLKKHIRTFHPLTLYGVQ